MKLPFLKSKLPENSFKEKQEFKTFFLSSGSPTWSNSNYSSFASEGYIKNVIAHRCINLLASAASFVPLKLVSYKNGIKEEIKEHALLDLLNKPDKLSSKVDFFESLYSYKLIAGNVYIKASLFEGKPIELNIIRPDKVSVLTGKNEEVCGYRVNSKTGEKDFYFNKITEKCEILHIKSFHPLNEYYGLSSVECARYAIDQHNEASNYAKALLQNSARPSGALIVKANEYNSGGNLTESQFERLKEQLYDQFSGVGNTGKPMLLEGGLDWKEMSISPKDMDFMENKNASSREIALAFGVPPQVLGLPGDNTYNNLMEARIAMWEQTIIPLITDALSAMSNWFSKLYNEEIRLEFNREEIPALTYKRESEWEKIIKADFLTEEEKREYFGFPRKK